jgi:hypothetical protein
MHTYLVPEERDVLIVMLIEHMSKLIIDPNITILLKIASEYADIYVYSEGGGLVMAKPYEIINL